VSAWADLSGNGRTLSQGTVNDQPGRTGTQNGLPTVVFDASTDFIQAATAADWKFMHDGTTYIFGIAWGTVDANPNKLAYVYSTADTDATKVGAQLVYDDRAAVPRDDRLIYYVLDGTAPPAVDGVVSADDAMPGGVVASVTGLLDPDASPSSGRAAIYTNNTLVSSTETSTSTPSSSNPQWALKFAGRSITTTYTSIQVCELVLVSGTDATDANRQLLDGYLQTKWGI
jgi:hypothetical protein